MLHPESIDRDRIVQPYLGSTFQQLLCNLDSGGVTQIVGVRLESDAEQSDGSAFDDGSSPSNFSTTNEAPPQTDEMYFVLPVVVA
jgi:hypothetical protein